MATHSSILAWKVPWTAEPGGIQSMELQRAGHDLVAAQACTPGIGTISSSLASSLGVLIAGGK